LSASFIDNLLEWLKPLFANWGYLIVFGGAFLESIFLTGWIAPGMAVILLGSFYAAHGELNVYLVGALAVVGALLGDNIGFLIGRKLGRGIMEKQERRHHLRRGMETSQRWFSRYGGVTVLFGRMVSGVDAFIPLTAGMGEMPYWKYMLFDIPGAIIWVSIITALGYFFGDNWETIVEILDWLGWGLLALVVLVAAIAYIIHRHRKNKEAATDESGE
jgi:membrane-associated protein